MIYGEGPILFNSLPRVIRGYEGSFNGIKVLVYIVLTEIPDRPCLNGYKNNNNDIFDKETNSIPTWIAYLKLQDWTPQDDVENNIIV